MAFENCILWVRIFFFRPAHTTSEFQIKEEAKMIADKIALLLTIIGAINWGLIGIFQFDLVASIFGGQAALVSRIIYTVVGAAGLWCISMLFRDQDVVKE